MLDVGYDGSVSTHQSASPRPTTEEGCRAEGLARPEGQGLPLLSPELKFHSLRHTFATLYVAAEIPPLEITRFMGHAKVTTTLTVYAHLFEDDHADAMDALGAMPKQHAGNVIQLRG